jgi:hypothetical protein
MYMAAHMYNDFLRIEVKHCICILYGEVISVFYKKVIRLLMLYEGNMPNSENR